MTHPNQKRWDQRFSAANSAAGGYLFGRNPNSFLAREAHRFASGGEVLAVADGEGRNSVTLAQQGLRVTAFDISPVGLAKARALETEAQVTAKARAAAAAPAIDFRLGDINEWAWTADQFDGVAAIFVQFATPPERRKMFAGIRLTLRAGGRLLLVGYTPKQLEYKTGGPSELDQLYTEAMLRDELAGLTIEHLRVYEETLDEGAGHSGRSALIEVVAVKALSQR